jgi:hypothetical protein
MTNPSQSHDRVAGIIALRSLGSTRVDLDDDALELKPGEAVMVEWCGDTARGIVTDARTVHVHLALGRVGDHCRIRRPRHESCSSGPRIAPRGAAEQRDNGDAR